MLGKVVDAVDQATDGRVVVTRVVEDDTRQLAVIRLLRQGVGALDGSGLVVVETTLQQQQQLGGRGGQRPTTSYGRHRRVNNNEDGGGIGSS